MINKTLSILKNLTILYAEDDLVVASSATRMLGAFCNNIFVANNGEDAIKIYNKEKPNIIILDIKMPIINGLEVASIIRKTDLITPIIIATSYKETDDILKAIKLNLAAYIIKPLNFNDLQTALVEAIDRLNLHGMLNRQITDSISYDFITKQIIKDDETIKLTKNETMLFEILLQKKGSLASYDYIEQHMGLEYFETKASLKNTVLRLRKKLGDRLIINIQDLGYMLP